MFLVSDFFYFRVLTCTCFVHMLARSMSVNLNSKKCANVIRANGDGRVIFS